MCLGRVGLKLFVWVNSITSALNWFVVSWIITCYILLFLIVIAHIVYSYWVTVTCAAPSPLSLHFTNCRAPPPAVPWQTATILPRNGGLEASGSLGEFPMDGLQFHRWDELGAWLTLHLCCRPSGQEYVIVWQWSWSGRPLGSNLGELSTSFNHFLTKLIGIVWHCSRPSWPSVGVL